MSQTTIDELVEKHAQLVEEARAIGRSFIHCKSAAEVDDTMRRFFIARQRAIDYLDNVVAMMRAKPDDLPRA